MEIVKPDNQEKKKKKNLWHTILTEWIKHVLVSVVVLPFAVQGFCSVWNIGIGIWPGFMQMLFLLLLDLRVAVHLAFLHALHDEPCKLQHCYFPVVSAIYLCLLKLLDFVCQQIKKKIFAVFNILTNQADLKKTICSNTTFTVWHHQRRPAFFLYSFIWCRTVFRLSLSVVSV